MAAAARSTLSRSEARRGGGDEVETAWLVLWLLRLLALSKDLQQQQHIPAKVIEHLEATSANTIWY